MNSNFIIGTIIGGVAVLVGAAILKSSKEKYAEVKVENTDDTTDIPEEEPKTIKEKVESKAMEAAAIVVEHQETIKAVTTVLGMFAAAVKLKNLIKDGKASSEPKTEIYVFKTADELASDDILKQFVQDLKNGRGIKA